MRPELKQRILDYNKVLAHNQAIVAMVTDAGGIHKTEPEQSDKLGYDWVHTIVGKTTVKTEYIEQENPRGTKENPFVWSADLELFSNAYYTHDGVRKVWMGAMFATAAWDDPNFAEF